MIEKCTKCGRVREVRHHHSNGYLGLNLDKTTLYCRSCDQFAHIKARKEGKCKLSHKDVSKLSLKSYMNRWNKKERFIKIRETVGKNIQLNEIIRYNPNTGNVTYYSWFQKHHINCLPIIDEIITPELQRWALKDVVMR